MTVIDLNKERQKAVRTAWKNEKAYVREGKGTRNWSQSEQRQIIAKGRAKGYEGHHMQSVKNYPQQAGNPKNIQFLNHSEHINGAHKGNPQNPTNGYYDPKTGQMHSFHNGQPKAPKAQQLSKPLTQQQQNLAIKREKASKQAVAQAKSEKKQAVSKQTYANQSSGNKGLKSYNKKISNNRQNQGNSSGKTTNRGLQAYQSKTNGESGNSAKASVSGNSGQAKAGAGSGKSAGGSGNTAGGSGKGK